MSITNTNSSATPVKGFFESFGNGDYQGILDAFHPETSITGGRAGDRKANEVYGTYHSIDGVKEMLANLSNAFDTQSFTVENILGGEGVAYANGKFVHKVKATGKLYASDWALYAVIKDGKIYEYHFYEDTEKFEEVNK